MGQVSAVRFQLSGNLLKTHTGNPRALFVAQRNVQQGLRFFLDLIYVPLKHCFNICRNFNRHLCVIVRIHFLILAQYLNGMNKAANESLLPQCFRDVRIERNFLPDANLLYVHLVRNDGKIFL